MYRYTNVKIDIFEKEFFFLQKGVVVGCWAANTINHQVYLKFSNMICLSINYYLVEENSINFNFKVSMFSSISSCRALLFKEIYKVEE